MLLISRCFWYGKESVLKRIDLLIWILCYSIFLFIGGVLITAIEQENDKNLKNEKRLNLISVMEKHNISSNDTAILEILDAALDAAAVGGIGLEKNLNEESSSSWGWRSGLFFCSTLVTTIGYGNIYPKTTGGRWFVIFYALIGIPLTGIVLAKTGARLTELIKKMDTKLAERLRNIAGKSVVEEKLKLYIRTIQLLVVVIFFIFFFWILPAIIFMETEHWDYVTAIYYCFITITTIGLGDVVPGGSETEITLAVAKQASTIVYFILGLSALAIILNLMKSLFDIVATSAKETAGNISNKGKSFAGNVAGSMKVKLNGRSNFIQQSTEVDIPDEEDETREYSPPTQKTEQSSPVDNFVEDDNVVNQNNMRESSTTSVRSPQKQHKTMPDIT